MIKLEKAMGTEIVTATETRMVTEKMDQTIMETIIMEEIFASD
jgi:hypothetical protein